MPITHLKSQSVPLVVDVQQAVLDTPSASPSHRAVRQARVLADAFRIPVVLAGTVTLLPAVNAAAGVRA